MFCHARFYRSILRYKVIAEIMQAMTVENLKQEEDFDGLLSQINSKSYRLSTRNLARYINQVNLYISGEGSQILKFLYRARAICDHVDFLLEFLNPLLL